MGVHVVAPHAVRFELDADTEAVRVGDRGERVAADQRRLARAAGLQPEREVLAGERSGNRLPARRDEPHRDDRAGLALHGLDPEWLEPLPRGALLLPLLEQLPERALPALAERRDAQRALELPGRAVGQVQKPVDVGDGDLLLTRFDPGDLVARLHQPLLEHAQVEPGPVAGHEQRWHRRLLHADAHPEARDAWLGDLEERLADPVAVAYADLVVGEPLDGEVLAELAVAEVVSAELALPVAVGLDLVDEHGAVLAAVSRAVSLVVAVDVDPPDHARPLDGVLPDGRADGLPLPGDLARQSDVDREQLSHDCVHVNGEAAACPGSG